MVACSAHGVAVALRAAAKMVDEHRDELVRLDREIGDGDHGENLNRGFTALVAALERDAPDSPGGVLKLVAEWARGQGLNVSDRGRIPAEVIEKFHAAH